MHGRVVLALVACAAGSFEHLHILPDNDALTELWFIGDLHGDYQKTLRLLQWLKLIEIRDTPQVALTAEAIEAVCADESRYFEREWCAALVVGVVYRFFRVTVLLCVFLSHVLVHTSTVNTS